MHTIPFPASFLSNKQDKYQIEERTTCKGKEILVSHKFESCMVGVRSELQKEQMCMVAVIKSKEGIDYILSCIVKWIEIA